MQQEWSGVETVGSGMCNILCNVVDSSGLNSHHENETVYSSRIFYRSHGFSYSRHSLFDGSIDRQGAL